MLSVTRTNRLALAVAVLAGIGAAQAPVGPTRAVAASRPQEPASTPEPEAAETPQEPDQGATEEGAQSEQEEPPRLPSLDEAKPFEWSWESALGLLTGRETFTAKDGKITFRLGIAAQVDGTAGSVSDRLEDNFGPIDSSADLRRLRISSHGRVQQMNYMLSFDLGTDLGLKDAWLEGRQGGLALWDTHLGKFRFGQMREPFGFENQTSSSFIGFLERSLPTATFAPGRNFGMMVHDMSEGGRVHWSAGMFSLGSSSEDGESSSLFSLTGRVTGLPIDSQDGKRLLHVGGSFSSRSPSSDTRYFSRPEARYVDPYADTGEIDASGINLFGAEVGGVYDSYWAQAEWIHSNLTAARSGDPDFYGGYVQVGWFITGENRPYRRNGGVFDRFRPELENVDDQWKFGERIMRGAWELVGRASHVDLDDGLVDGGRLTDLSAALNWYVSPATRLQLNYIYSMPQDKGNANIFLIRFQYHPW